jgi:E3 ubiquitin-protein ligase HERC3
MDGALNGKTVKDVAVANDFTVILTEDGQVFTCGSNSAGQLGTGTGAKATAPVAVDRTGVLNGKFISKIAIGSDFVVALDNIGKLYTWGAGANGVLGINSITNSHNPVQVTTPAGVEFADITAGLDFVIASTTENTMYGWGAVNNIGIGKSPAVPALNELIEDAVQVVVDTGSAKILTKNNELYEYGAVYGMQLRQTVPVKINTDSLNGATIQKVTGYNSFTAVLTTDGKVFCMGEGTVGALGNNSTGSSSTFIRVESLVDYNIRLNLLSDKIRFV